MLEDFPNRTKPIFYMTYHRIAKAACFRNSHLLERPWPISSLPDRNPQGQNTEIVAALRLNDVPHDCPHGLVIDEDGLVRVTKDCEGCAKCARGKDAVPVEPQIISEEDIKGYRKTYRVP